MTLLTSKLLLNYNMPQVYKLETQNKNPEAKAELSNGRREANLQRSKTMAKGDDNVQRKKNKLTRKKMSRKNDTATVSARIAAIIAAKKRRKSGKRSMCQVSHSFTHFSVRF